MSFGEVGAEIVAANMRKGLGLETNVKGRKARAPAASLRAAALPLLSCCLNPVLASATRP